MSYILLKNCNLFDGQSKTLQPHSWILIKDHIIEKVSSTEIKCKEAEVIDVQNKTVIPGLIDAHVHVMAAKIDLANKDIPISEISLQAARFMEDMLMRGFTSIRDAGGADMGLASALNRGLVKGPRLFYCGKALSQTGGHGDFRKPGIEGDIFYCTCSGSSISVIADGVSEVRKAAREEIRKGATQIKIMASGGVASPTDRITNLQYSVAEIQAIVEEAENAGIYVMAHAYTPEAIIRCVEHGVRTIEHGNLLNDEAAAAMVAKNAYLVPTLVTYQALDHLGPSLNFPLESLLKIKKVIDRGLQAIELAHAHGIKVGFGTDLLGQEGHKWQAKEFIIRSAIEEPFDILTSATRINAEILNHAGRLGVIAPNAFADLLVVDGNPLQDISLLAGQGEALDLIMKDGVIYKNRLS